MSSCAQSQDDSQSASATRSASGRPVTAGMRSAPNRFFGSARSGTRVAGFHAVSHLSPDFFKWADVVYFHSAAPIFKL